MSSVEVADSQPTLKGILLIIPWGLGRQCTENKDFLNIDF